MENGSSVIRGRFGEEPRSAGVRVSHLKPLTGLRFVAAMLVVVFHYGLRTGEHFPSLFSVGFVGVSFFFLLSGFILVYNYVDPEAHLRGTRRNFWVARFARIYPVYLFALLVAAGPFLWVHHSLVSRAVTGITSLTLTQAWVPSPAGTTWDGPGWSLSAEAFFYLLFPACAIYIARLNRRRLYLVLGIMWVASVALAIALGHLDPTRGDFDHSWSWERILNYDPLVRLPEFLMGVALGRLFADRVRHQGATTTRYASPAIWSLIALGSIVVTLSWAHVLPTDLISTGLFAPLFALLIYALAFSKGPLAALLSTPAMVLLGEASYALYILHYPIWDWMNRVLSGHRTIHMGTLSVFTVYVVIVIGTSILSLRLIEQPARRAIRRAFAEGALATSAEPRAGIEAGARLAH